MRGGSYRYSEVLGIRLGCRLGVGLSIKLNVMLSSRQGSLAVGFPMMNVRLGIQQGVESWFLVVRIYPVLQKVTSVEWWQGSAGWRAVGLSLSLGG